MSFFSSLKRAFGFGGYDDFDENNADGEMDVADTPADNDINAETPPPALEPAEAPVVDAAMKAKIFEGVVKVFNESLPDFLARSVDPEKQKAVLAESLDSSVDAYLQELLDKAGKYAEYRLRNAADTARRESEKLRTDMQQLEQQRTSLREQQLSADRRRRALADRVTDLEAQISACEADREQLQLENKSLLNKLKVAEVQPGVVEDMAREIERLKGLQTNSEIGEVLYNDLQKFLVEEKEARAKAEEEAAAANSELEGMRERLEESEAALAQTRGELEEAGTLLKSVEDMQQQMAQVADLIKKRDERIAKLKASNKRLKEKVAYLEDFARSQRQADGGLFDLAEEPSEAMPTGDRDSFAAPAPDDFASIEEEFECPEWFVSEPAPGEPGLRVPDSDFGYTEPPKKPRHPDNDAQLSLF